MPKRLAPLLIALTLSLAACGQPSSSPVPAGQVAANDTLLEAQAVGNPVSLQAGQSRQLSVTVGGKSAQPGQLKWSTSNAAVVTVTQGGLVSAAGAGSASVRAALSSNTSAYLEFPITVSAAPAPSPAPSAGGISAVEQRVLDLTNQARAVARSCGTTAYPAAAPLTWNAQLAASARGHAADMAARNYFDHTSQDGRTFVNRIVNAGYTGYRAIAENIAAGQPTPEEVVSGWVASPGHCANIMNAALRELGVGSASSSTSSYGIYWVQDFGAH